MVNSPSGTITISEPSAPVIVSSRAEAGQVAGSENSREQYEKRRIRAKDRMEREHRGGENIIVTELPYQVLFFLIDECITIYYPI